jgi:hypothetical protein
MPHEHLLNRIRAEYLEMPGLRLTREQMQRLCGVEPTICQLVLDTLVATRFLYVKADRTYARLTEGEIPYARAAKANLRPEQRFVKAS